MKTTKILLAAPLMMAFSLSVQADENDCGQRISADFAYSLSWGTLGLDHTRSISAVDDSVSISSAASMHYQSDSNRSIRLRIGQSDNAFSTEKTMFATLGLGYRF